MAHRAHLFASTAVFLTATASAAWAQQPPAGEIELDTIVVSASQVPVEQSRVGSAVSIVTAEEIEARGHDTLTDVLRSIPGVAVSQQGSRGTVSQVRIRGGEANHTLVLVDGVEVNSLGNGFFDFADFLAQEIERVEVLRGPQSGIYGAGAHYGVVSVVTKSGRGLNGARFNALAEGGSYGTGRTAASFQGGNGQVYGALNFDAYRTSGFNISRFGSERDDSDAFVGSAKLGIDITPDFNVEGFLRHTNRHAQSDPQSSTSGLVIDGDNANENRATIGRITATHSVFGGRWVNTTSASFLDERVEFRDDPAALFPNDFLSNGRRYDFEHKSTLTAETAAFGGEKHTFTVKADYRDEEFDYVSGFSTPAAAEGISRDRTGLAGEYILDLPTQTTISGALRQDWNDGFEDATTWRLAASQRFDTGTRVHASVGTGVTNPTFIEQFGIFGNFVGNPDLRPEESLGWDVGVEQKLFDDRLVVDVTYFSARMKDEIVSASLGVGGPFTLANLIGRSRREGVEVTATWRPTDWLDLAASYTYTDARNDDDVRLIRRPRHAASFDATARFLEDRAKASLGIVYNGTMEDDFFATFPAERVTLASYTLLSAKISYDVTKEVTVFARAENVLDQDYEEVFSYRAPGFAAYAGVKIALGRE